MLSTARRLAGVTAAAVVAAGIAVPLSATPAQAVVAPDRTWVVGDPDGDGWMGLYRSEGPTGAQTAVDVGPRTWVHSVSASRDGSRIIYVRERYRSDYSPIAQEVVVRDTSGRLVRVLESQGINGSLWLGTPVLSPSGLKAAWDLSNDETDAYLVKKANVGSGSPSLLINGHSPYAFLTEDTVLVQDVHWNPYTVSISAGGRTPVTGLSPNAYAVTVSPDGTKAAYTLYGPPGPDDAARASVVVAPLTSSNGAWELGAGTTLDSALHNRQVAFSRDGATLYWLKNSGLPKATGDLWTAPVDGSLAASRVAATPGDERDIAFTNAPALDTVPPADATVQPFVLNGTTPTIRWAQPGDGDLSGVVVSRPGKSVYVPWPQTSFMDSGLTLGETYTYTIKAVDRSGNLSAGASRQLTAIKAGAFFGTPTSQYSTTASFPVRFAAGANADTTFWVNYTPYGGSLKTWVNGVSGAFRTFGAPGTTGVTDTTVVAGGTYTFAVRAQDAFGNSSGWVGGAKAVVPVDQTRAAFSGGTDVTASNAYLGSFRQLRTTASYARVSLVGSKLMIVGWKCASCGQFALYDGSTKIATVNTYAASMQPRVLLFSKAYTRSGTHTFTIRPLGTPGRPSVNLDGFAMLR